MLKSKHNIERVVIGIVGLFVLSMPVFAAETLPAKQEQLDRKSAELKEVENNISLADAECPKLSSQYELAQRDAQQKKAIHQKAKDTYDRASKNADMFTTEQIVQFLNDYKNAEKELKTS